MFDIPGYILMRQDRAKRRAGGVCAYVKEELKATRIMTLITTRSELYELLWFKCSMSGISSCLIYVISSTKADL